LQSNNLTVSVTRNTGEDFRLSATYQIPCVSGSGGSYTVSKTIKSAASNTQSRFRIYAGTYNYVATSYNNEANITTCASAPLTIMPFEADYYTSLWILKVNGVEIDRYYGAYAYFSTPNKRIPYYTIEYSSQSACGIRTQTFYCYNQDCGIFAIEKNGNVVAKAQNNTFSAYPNPANSTLNLSFENQSQSPVRLLLSNTLGVVVLENKEINLDSNQKTSIDLSLLPEGIYILQVQYADGNIATQKIAVQRGTTAN
jgi:hypothetical protein